MVGVLPNQTAAHIHAGRIMDQGNVLAPLPVGNFTDYRTVVSPAVANEMLLGRTYLNLHSISHPAGTTCPRHFCDAACMMPLAVGC
jgi:hypothetical protein